MELPRCTIEDLLSWRPCHDWPESRIRGYARGRTAFNALDVLRLRSVSAEDRLWVVLREALVPAPLLHEFACRCAEEMLPLYEAQYPNDPRPRNAIATKRAWLRGEITAAQLDAARDAARAAAEAAASAAQCKELLHMLREYAAQGATDA